MAPNILDDIPRQLLKGLFDAIRIHKAEPLPKVHPHPDISTPLSLDKTGPAEHDGFKSTCVDDKQTVEWKDNERGGVGA